MELTLRKPYLLSQHQTLSGTELLALVMVKTVKGQIQKLFDNPVRLDVDYGSASLGRKTSFRVVEMARQNPIFSYLGIGNKNRDKRILFSVGITSYGDWCHNSIECKVHYPELNDLVKRELESYAQEHELVLAPKQ